jgi:hypothetical protein
MSSAPQVAHELGLLRRIAERLTTTPLPAGRVTEDFLRAQGLVRARRTSDALIGLTAAGDRAFAEFSERLISRSPEIERGIAISKIQEELFGVISDFLNRDGRSITTTDVLEIEKRLSDWFASIASDQTVFLPCMISPWPSPCVSVGPVTFIHVDHIRASEYYPPGGMARDLPLTGFDNFLADMSKEHAHWLAIVNVKRCDNERAQEVGALAVDLAIVAFQAAAPNFGTKNISRLATRRGPPRD